MSEFLAPIKVPLPGQRLKDEIEKRLWTQEDLARIIGRPPQTISEIISGKKQITPTTALELAKAFGTSPEFWNKLESDYQLYLARKSQTDNDDIAKRSFLFDILPVREIVKRNWLDIKNPQDLTEFESQLYAFAGVSNINEMPKLAANFKMSTFGKRTPETRGNYAWLLRVRNLARSQKVGTFDPKALAGLIQELLLLSPVPENIQQVPGLLKDAGIRYVVVPHLPKTYLDGAAFYLDGNPVIAMTLRYDRIDNYWFVLLHELCHILLGHPDVFLDEVIRSENRPSKSAFEQEADACARSYLVDSDRYQLFVEETFMDLDEEKIKNFAEQVKRHPGIILGRLQWDEALHFSQGRHLLEKIRHHLTGIVDRA